MSIFTRELLGIKGLFAKRGSVELNEKHSNKTITVWKAFSQGLLCNLLNPKAIMFLLAFFTLIVRPGSSLFSEMGYGLEIAVIHFIWFSSLSMMVTLSCVKKHLGRVQFYIVKAMGAVLVAFGVRIATLSRAVM